MLKTHPFILELLNPTRSTNLALDVVTKYEDIQESSIPLIAFTTEDYKFYMGDIYRVVKDNNVHYYLAGFNKQNKYNGVTDFMFYPLKYDSYKFALNNPPKQLFSPRGATSHIFEVVEGAKKVEYLGNIFLHDVSESLSHLIDKENPTEDDYGFKDFIDIQNELWLIWYNVDLNKNNLQFSVTGNHLLKLRLIFKAFYLNKNWSILYNKLITALDYEVGSDELSSQSRFQDFHLGRIYKKQENLDIDLKHRQYQPLIHIHENIAQKKMFHSDSFMFILTDKNKLQYVDLSTFKPTYLSFEEYTMDYALDYYLVVEQFEEFYDEQYLKFI